jgi:hypothetical protein
MASCNATAAALDALIGRPPPDDVDSESGRLKRCRPWDRLDFDARVGTFSPARWFDKPSAVSGPVCAAFGFVCVAVDVVACPLCQDTLAFKANPALSTHRGTSSVLCSKVVG